jgi:tRNA C32,U32 (ribose-2'-O)-methylase TrmJ
VAALVRANEPAAIASGFLGPDEPKRRMQGLQRLFSRGDIEREEVAI